MSWARDLQGNMLPLGILGILKSERHCFRAKVLRPQGTSVSPGGLVKTQVIGLLSQGF